MNPRFTYLDGQLSARGDKFPSSLVPCLVTTAPPFGFHPFLTPQFTLHYLHRRRQQSRPSLSGTVSPLPPPLQRAEKRCSLSLQLLDRDWGLESSQISLTPHAVVFNSFSQSAWELQTSFMEATASYECIQISK